MTAAATVVFGRRNRKSSAPRFLTGARCSFLKEEGPGALLCVGDEFLRTGKRGGQILHVAGNNQLGGLAVRNLFQRCV